jgi:hypothetical protein
VLADINVSLPLGSIDRELIRLAEDSGARVPWTVIVRLCGSMESIETMEDVLEMSGEMMLSLPPQETMRLAIRRITTRAPRASISMVHASRGRDIRQVVRRELTAIAITVTVSLNLHSNANK